MMYGIKIKIHESIAAILVVMLFCAGCSKTEGAKRGAVRDRSSIAVLEADSVTTLISDSGVVRYRISAPHWDIYDKSDPPYWEMRDGIYLERFNELLETEGSLEADYAYYDENAQIWRLRGHVKALNLEGERFETEELYWNQKTERVYSDSTITITRSETVIRGIGFDSNQTMTEYTIRRPSGVIPLEE